MKHTPGPWEVSEGYRGPVGGPQETYYIEVLKSYNDGSYDVICDLPPYQGNNPKANTRLISAAPEMLEACQLAAEMIQACRKYFPKSIRNSDTFSLNVTCACLNKAIAKAEGR